MKKYFSIGLVTIAFLLNSCSNVQSNVTNTNLSATEFATKIKSLKSVEIIDVRTPDEFSKGHLQNAKNFDWNGDNFEQQIAALDRSKPVMVYCLSGGRSSSAAAKMRSEGFKEVYELDGGIMKWRAANLPETTDNASVSKGMSQQQFNDLLKTDKLVLIDFYADWCAPCKKMKPSLDEISTEMKDNIIVVRINADDNQALCKSLQIDALPTLQLYKNEKLIWANTGFLEKNEIVKQVK